MKLVLDLREKIGREGIYLFASVPAWNLLVFVHPNGERGGVKRYELVIKPYTGANDGGEGEYAGAWKREDSAGPSPISEGKSHPKTSRP